MGEQEQYIDARSKKELEILDKCGECGNEYVMRLHLKKRCGPCRTKAIEEIFESSGWSEIWKKADELFDSVSEFFDKVASKLKKL